MLCPGCGAPNAGGKFCVECGGALVAPAPAPAEGAKVEHPGGERAHEAAAYLSLQPSEAAVLAAASRIFAAYVAAGQVTDDNEPDLVNRAVRAALRLALITERVVQSDTEEW